jgi:hypothetical protein
MLHDHIALLKQSPLAKTTVSGEQEWNDMAVIRTQGLLLCAGGLVCQSFYRGDMGKILCALAHTAHLAVEAIIATGETDPPPSTPAITPLYELVPIMQHLCACISTCRWGRSVHYVTLYHCCSRLASDFLNADFDKTFADYHCWRQGVQDISDLSQTSLPDLTDCLYE